MNDKGIKIMQIAYGSDAYLESLNLRNEILRKPLGQSLFDEDRSAEAHDFHVAAYIDGVMTGILLLTPRAPGTVQMRQVAVAREAQGTGLGSQIVRFCEELAAREGFTLMMLHARETAVNFYLKNGYRVEGGMFEEVTIPHFKMVKEL